MKSCVVKILKWGIATLGLVLLIINAVNAYETLYYAPSSRRVERITGVKVPSYKVIEYDKGERGSTGDYNDSYTIEFKTMPPDALFDEIDRMIAAGKTGWSRNGNKYSFSVIWGNGLPAPEGEDEEDDGTFSISITRGEKRGTIDSGTW